MNKVIKYTNPILIEVNNTVKSKILISYFNGKLRNFTLKHVILILILKHEGGTGSLGNRQKWIQHVQIRLKMHVADFLQKMPLGLF